MYRSLFVNHAVIVGVVALLCAAAIEDVRRFKIPNRYCLGIVLLYPIHVLTAPSGVDWLDGLVAGIIALAIGFLLYCMRLAGGGDIKLFAAVALWAGGALIVPFALATTVVGGIFAVIAMIRRSLAAPRRPASANRLGLGARFWLAVQMFLGRLVLARHGIASLSAASVGGDVSVDDSRSPEEIRAAGMMPYGTAIVAGGLVVIAMLVMKR